MLEAILTKCDERYRKNEGCRKSKEDCNFCDTCTNCGECLRKIHFGEVDRVYDCKRMADYYTCRYSCRYASEIICAIRNIRIDQIPASLKVLSLGCGPCTDLFAIKHLQKNGELQYTALEYKGVDCGKDVWETIHDDIKSLARDNEKIDFIYEDMQEYIDSELQNCSWIPNIIIFQYVFSDMKKRMPNVSDFIEKFAAYYKNIPSDCLVIVNDINCDQENSGGRNYFDALAQKLGVKEPTKLYFDDGNLCDWKKYGNKYAKNELLCDVKKWEAYTTSTQQSCASAQMIIKKSDTETK